MPSFEPVFKMDPIINEFGLNNFISDLPIKSLGKNKWTFEAVSSLRENIYEQEI
jgi:hypothetical protein